MIIHNADILKWIDAYEGDPFHALFADPPYHLTSIVKRFGGDGAVPAQFGQDGAFARATKGFMGKTWDGGDIAYRPETWAKMGSVLYDGAFGFAFASTRGYHRMACAIEDAGFIIHPMITWAFGSGFPKATRVHDPRFEGHRYGAQALKPAIEPICVFQKPYKGKPTENILDSGAGTLNIDGGRIALHGEIIKVGFAESKRNGVDNQHEGWSRPWMQDGQYYGDKIDRSIEEANTKGRWPSNLILAHSTDCTSERCSKDCAIKNMSDQTGERKAGGNIINAQSVPMANIYAGNLNRIPVEGYGDTGTAARFFYNADWMLDRLEESDPFIYAAKASQSERSLGLENFDQQTIDDGRQKSIDNPYQRGETERRNPHPTVKPLSLTKYLAQLLLPPNEYAPRRLLVPFAGSGSEMIGALLAGWEVVEGVEMETEYVGVAEARLKYWRRVYEQEKAKMVQLSMF